jgi:hypothetical protein
MTRLKVYAVLGIAAGVAAYLSGMSPPWSAGIGMMVPLVVSMTPRFVIGLLRGAGTPGAYERPGAAQESMSGLEFEDYVARIARGSGAPVIMTPLSGDWGVDLIVGRRPNRLAVQCKRQSRPVGTSAVQEVVAGAPMQDCTRTMVVTNHDFTPAARRLAELHGCVLVGGEQLTRLGSTIRRLTAPDDGNVR